MKAPGFRLPTSRTWVLVANQSMARIYGTFKIGRDLSLVKELDHPEGRLHGRELDSDRPGRLFKMATGGNRSGTNDTHESEDHQAVSFAKKIARLIEDGRTHNEFDHLVLVAAPRFLGRIRESLSNPTLNKVIGSIGKDLVNHPEREVISELSLQLRDLQRVS